MEDTRDAFFDPETVAILRDVLDDAWSRLPAGQTGVTRSLLAERLLRPRGTESVTPSACEPDAITDCNEDAM